ncbi:MAG: hypothetical protein JRJ58_08815 [Deltaproteobacteria bacterium]|nr:hypothetical protein [Deltaproteobacteria bacterium]
MKTALRAFIVASAAAGAGLLLFAAAGSAQEPISGQALAAIGIAVCAALFLTLLGESPVEDAVKLACLALVAFFAPTSGMPLILIAPLIGATCGAIGNWILRQLREPRPAAPDP